MKIIVATSNFVEIANSLFAWGKGEGSLSPITPTQKRKQAKVLFKRAVNAYFSCPINNTHQMGYALKDMQAAVNLAVKHGFEI